MKWFYLLDNINPIPAEHVTNVTFFFSNCYNSSVLIGRPLILFNLSSCIYVDRLGHIGLVIMGIHLRDNSHFPSHIPIFPIVTFVTCSAEKGLMLQM